MSDLSDDAGSSASQDDTSRVWTSNSVVGDVSGVVVQAQNIGTVMFGASGAASIPIEDAICDLDPVLDAVLDAGFTGREWLISEIDQFIEQRRCGYVWVEAPAGLGKSALAAHLVQARGWVGHFARVSRGGTTRVGLQNLAGQLILRYQLEEDCAPGRMLPERASTPEGFERVLGRAARRARGAGDRLVLVVDGADEADPADGQQPWGLPADLPTGVFVIGTYRTGFPPPPAQPCQVLHIHPGDDRNQHDLTDHLDAVVHAEDIAACLAAAGASPDRFVVDVAQRCGGVWVYLRYILEEVRRGLRDPQRLDDLPADLSSYYTATLQRWSADPAWQEGILPVLATLAVAGESVTSGTLAALSGVNEGLVRQWCHGSLRPFLTATLSTTPGISSEATLARGFEIYHGSMRELLTGAPPPAGSSDHGWMWSELLRSAAITAHHRTADYYLSLFGGLDTDLARLADSPDLATGDGGYALWHLARHLVRAGRAADLHRLLCAERSVGPGRATNVWFAAHDGADTIDDYLADVATARQDSEHRTDHALAAGLPAASLAEELRYWLITASISSLATTISPALLLNLWQHRMWTAARVLSHARRLPTAEARAEALTLLVPHLPAEQQPAALAGALDAATHITDQDAVAQDAKAAALTALAPHLPADQQPVALTQALDAATRITDEAIKARALTRLAPHLTARQQHAVLSQALEGAARIGTDDSRLAPVWAELAQQLPAKLLAQALETATHMEGQEAKAQALVGLAPYLPAKLLTRALDTATEIYNDNAQAQALVGLAPHLPAKLLAKAVQTATHIHSQDAEALALAGLGPHLPAEQQRAVLAQALDTATHIIDQGINAIIQTDQVHTRARLLIGLAPYMPAALLAQALDAATYMDDHEYIRAEALVGLAPYLPPELLAKALDVAINMGESHIHVSVLVGLAPYLPPELLAKALDVAIHIAHPYMRADASAGLAPYLSAEQQRAVLAKELDTVTHISDEGIEAQVLVRLAPHLPTEQQRAVLAEMLDTVTHISDEGVKAQVLVGLAPHVPTEQQRALLAQALEATTHITTSYGQADALAELAPHLPTELLGKALYAATHIADAEGSLAAGMFDGESRGRALVGLAPYLTPELLADALDAASRITTKAVNVFRLFPPPEGPDEQAQAQALVGLAPYLPAELLVKALDAATHLTHKGCRAEVLAELAPLFRAEQQEEVLAGALDAATHLTHKNHRAELLAGLVPLLPAEQQEAVLAKELDAARHLTHPSTRSLVLAALAPRLRGEQQRAVLTEAMEAATQPMDEGIRARALVGLAPYLPADQLAEALDAAIHIPDQGTNAIRLSDGEDGDRAHALIGLAPYLPADQLVKALDAVPYGDVRSRLAVLARAEELFGFRSEFVSLLRIVFLNADQVVSLKVLPSCIAALRGMAGRDFDEHAVAAVRAVHRWWP